MTGFISRQVFQNWELVPAAWATERPVEEFFVTNPAIQRVNGQLIMAYKVVTPHYGVERFAICRLDAALDVVPGSVTPLSGTIPNITPQV